ncbi:MAG TPA: AMP-binding protein [Streptosporangiaceae bacterium]
MTVLDDIRSCLKRVPDAIAVQDGELRLTYLRLAGHASDLAARLPRRGVGQDDVVAIYSDRSAELAVAELSVLLAGAAYLPLDPAHPATRISQQLALALNQAAPSPIGRTDRTAYRVVTPRAAGIDRKADSG